jgi:hypothetical protein
LNQEPGGEIRKHVVQAWQGQPYIPGSSIKGSIITALHHRLGRNVNLGRFAGSLGTYIRVSDSAPIPSQPYFANTKTFYINLNKHNATGWREGRGDSLKTLNPITQVVTYECIPSGSSTSFSIQFPETNFPRAEVSQGLQEFKRLGNNHLSFLLQSVHDFNVTHVQRELAFFEQFEHPDTKPLVAWFQNLLEEANQPGKYLFRLGNGCGLHHLTAEFTHENHADLQGIRRNLRLGNTFGKTRKLTFSFDSKQKLHIGTLGFCWLALEPIPEAIPAPTLSESSIAPAVQPPSSIPMAQLKDGKVLFAIAKDFKDKKLLLELMVEGLENQVFPMTYASGADYVGKNLEVEVHFINRKDPKKGFNLKLKKFL